MPFKFIHCYQWPREYTQTLVVTFLENIDISHIIPNIHIKILVSRKHVLSYFSTSKHNKPKIQWELVTGTCNSETTLVFGRNILNLKGSIGKGTNR